MFNFPRRYWHFSLIIAVLVALAVSFSPVSACYGCGSIDTTKSVSGTLEVGSIVTYTIVMTNTMPWDQDDNPGNEFVDVLPAQLQLISAGTNSGTAVANVGINTVTWNGSIPSGASVTVTITAQINPATEGQVIANQGIVAYDNSNGGTNNASTMTDDPLTIAIFDPTLFTVLEASGEPPVEPAAPVEAPPPPATPLCETHNFDEGGVVRGSVSDAFGFAINCRVLYQNGEPTSWLGGDLYGASSIGIPGIVELGVQQAVDIFSPPGMTSFAGGAVVCLKGTGTLIWIAASGMPRHAEIIGSYEVPEWEGFTCATLFEPGTLVLVKENPLA